MKRYFTLLMLIGFLSVYSQDDKDMIKKFFDNSMSSSVSYELLDHLSNEIGGRLSGSLNAERAVEWGRKELIKVGFDKVWLQDVMVPKWVRGPKEFALIETQPGTTFNVDVCALGGSVATPSVGIKSNVIEVYDFDELKILGKEKIDGKIVFFNRPMQPNLINTFQAYGEAVSMRVNGAAEAVKYGAIGVIIRSMSLRLDDFPHTGVMSYGNLPPSKRIPAAAISTNAAEKLSNLLKINPDLKFLLRQQCKQFKDVKSHNVIAEIKGSTYPNEIILVGGHLDSWDLGDGSHDDGAGIVQSIDVLNILNKSGYKPKRTIRVVLFMNEENGLRGAIKYAEVSKNNSLNHIFALESDAGGFTPLGFSFTSNEENFSKISEWKNLFDPYLIQTFVMGGSGADISLLEKSNNVLAGLRPDSQRYFDYHHAANDTFDAINKRELELGAFAMTSLIYLFDKYGINN
ncbi:MAG: peptidase M28 family protein [Flavobacteriaceae bacterium]|nr:peptidase M28 family protein [Flavobacteriaceae bacterium]RCL66777.1 MAG: peptidase M28 family protein [Cryomorphaceae bacterium]